MDSLDIFWFIVCFLFHTATSTPLLLTANALAFFTSVTSLASLWDCSIICYYRPKIIITVFCVVLRIALCIVLCVFLRTHDVSQKVGRTASNSIYCLKDIDKYYKWLGIGKQLKTVCNVFNFFKSHSYYADVLIFQ